MKLLLLFSFCIFSVCAFGQIPNNRQPWRFQIDSLKNFKGNNGDLSKQLQDYLLRKKLQATLANKQGNIIFLPQDHMPCIIPNTSGIAAIPNAWGGSSAPYRPQFHPIPNPALPKMQSYQGNVLDNSLATPSK